jgi:hypothetical protein
LNNNNNSNNRGNNNSNNNNNRRRGRSNRPNGGGGGGGQQLNRIDSRARGNAPQLLEKYRKLAQDAHLNGDRVQAEYYLQFADHYFRVTADSRVRTDEQRARPGERWEGGEEGDDGSDFSLDSDFPSFDQPSYNRAPREDRPRQAAQGQDAEQGQDIAPGQDAPQGQDTTPGQDAPQRRDARPERNRPRVQDIPRNEAGDSLSVSVGAEADSSEPAELDVQPNSYEPPANPFVRDNRNRAGLRPRRAGRPSQDSSDDADDSGAEPVGLDPALLPPAISAGRDADLAEDAAKPRRGRPRKKPTADDTGEALESVS